MAAPTITAAEVAVAIRAATAADAVPQPVEDVLRFIVPAASNMVEQHAPAAPVDVANVAVIRLAGWFWDSEPGDSQIGRAMELSGAASMLAQWRVHRAGLIAGESAPTPRPGGGGVPTPPADGSYILRSINGEVEWVSFPTPP